MERTKIKCPNCNYEGECKPGRSSTIHFLFLFSGLFLFPIWFGWIVYILMTKNCICPKCDNKNVVKC